MQTCRNINVHVVNTDKYMLRNTWMFMDSMIAPINVHSSHELKKMGYYCLLRSYKKRIFFFLFYVFFDVESDSEVRFCRFPLFFKL